MKIADIQPEETHASVAVDELQIVRLKNPASRTQTTRWPAQRRQWSSASAAGLPGPDRRKHRTKRTRPHSAAVERVCRPSGAQRAGPNLTIILTCALRMSTTFSALPHSQLPPGLARSTRRGAISSITKSLKCNEYAPKCASTCLFERNLHEPQCRVDGLLSPQGCTRAVLAPSPGGRFRPAAMPADPSLFIAVQPDEHAMIWQCRFA